MVGRTLFDRPSVPFPWGKGGRRPGEGKNRSSLKAESLHMKKILRKNPITAVLSAITILVFLIPGAEALIEFPARQNSLLVLYQIFGCHLLHWSLEHLFWDLGMFMLVGGLCERICRTEFVWTLGISAVLIPPIVAVFHPEMNSYRGLSGIDTALFGLGGMSLLIQKLRDGDQMSALIFGALIA